MVMQHPPVMIPKKASFGGSTEYSLPAICSVTTIINTKDYYYCPKNYAIFSQIQPIKTGAIPPNVK